MKRVFFTALALFGVGLGCLIGGGLRVSSSAAAVELTETIRAGDRSAAEGLAITWRCNCRRKLYWVTEWEAGDGAETAVSTFQFSPSQKAQAFEPAPWESSTPGIGLWNNLEYSFTSTSTGGGLDFEKFSSEEDISPEAAESAYMDEYVRDYFRLWKAAAEQVSPGTERTVLCNVSDYYPFYSFRVSFMLSGKMDGSLDLLESPKIQAFFRIPVPEPHEVAVRVKKNAAGKVTELESQSQTAVTSEEALRMGELHFEGTCTGTAIYCAFDNSGVFSGPYDTSHIPGGFGIYCLPYRRDEQGIARLDGENLILACPLSEEETIICLASDSLGRVLLFSWKDGATYLTVFAQRQEGNAGLKQLQRLKLGETEARSGLGLQMEEDFFYLDLGDRLLVAELDSENRWMLALELENPERPDPYTLSWKSVCDWDGSRLAILRGFSDDPSANRNRGLFLTVYSGEGLEYCGEYRSSLRNIPSGSGLASMTITEPFAKPYTVQWRE